MKRILIILLLIAIHSSSAQVPTPTPEAASFARRVAGCYQLDDGPWRADSVQAGGVSTRQTPLFFVLTDQLLRGWDSLQSGERPMFAVRAHSARLTYWQRISPSGEAIRISYPMPEAGIRLELTPRGNDLRGFVTAFTDALRENEPSEVTRPVYAHRAPCPSDSGRSSRSRTLWRS
jgi:hypothetical protein